jgi:septal ring factor EnvC (AmiA/AmiB activator)
VDDEPLLDGREHMPFESADGALGLYATAHDAKTLGNLAEERKREIEELQYTHKVQFMNMEHEFKRLTHDMETRMVEYKRERGEREMELATEVSRLKLVEMRLEQEAKEREARYATEKAERESRMLRDKEYYERRSYDRKDSSEIVKWVPAMVLGAGVLLSKFF